MNFENMSPEQREKTLACSTPEEMLELAKAEGYELADEELEQISGGGIWSEGKKCPRCGGDTWRRPSDRMLICLKCDASVPD